MSEWIVDSLNRLVVFQKGRKVQTSDFELPGYAPYLGAGALSGNDDRYASTILAIMANEQDVLMLWDGERSGLVGHGLSGVVSSTVSKLTPTGKINSRLLYYLLLFNFEWIQNRRTGTGVPHVPKDLGRILKLSYPVDLGLQGKIAYILSSIDQAIKKTETLIEKYQQIKAGLMHDLFTRGIGADGKLRPSREQAPELYQKTPIGWIPKEWSVRQLAEFSDICSGVTLGSKKTPDQTISVPYLRVANVQDGYLDLSDVKEIMVNRKTFDSLLLQAGDVLMNEGGDFDKLGRGTVWQGEITPCIHQNHVFRVRTNAQVLRHYFLAYWSQSAYGKKYFVLSSKQSTNLASINSTQLKKFPVALPSLYEQTQIEERVDAVNLKITFLNSELEKFKNQKSGLMYDLLTGKVLVKVDESEQVPA